LSNVCPSKHTDENCNCNRNYSPVCFDGQTFDNQCLAECSIRKNNVPPGAPLRDETRPGPNDRQRRILAWNVLDKAKQSAQEIATKAEEKLKATKEKADKAARMGLISDIHTELRKADALMLNYSSKTAID
jgi:enoyl-CoA hydratase/carnithine racemase